MRVLFCHLPTPRLRSALFVTWEVVGFIVFVAEKVGFFVMSFGNLESEYLQVEKRVHLF